MMLKRWRLAIEWKSYDSDQSLGSGEWVRTWEMNYNGREQRGALDALIWVYIACLYALEGSNSEWEVSQT
jgi:hypothetical protein